MEELIKQAFVHVDVIGPHVQAGHYDLIGPNGEQLSSTDPYNTTVSAPFKLQE